MLVPTKHSKAATCFCETSMKTFCNEILKLLFVCSLPVRERLVDSHEGLEDHKVFFCNINQKHFLNGMLKLFFVYSAPLRERLVDSHEGPEGHKVFL